MLMEDQVVAAVLSIAQRRNPALTAVSRDQALLSLGFDSLDLAQLVAVLESETGLDPFATQAMASVRTVGDLCDSYAQAQQLAAKST